MALAFLFGFSMTPAMASPDKHDSDHKSSQHDKNDHDKKKHDDDDSKKHGH